MLEETLFLGNQGLAFVPSFCGWHALLELHEARRCCVRFSQVKGRCEFGLTCRLFHCRCSQGDSRRADSRLLRFRAKHSDFLGDVYVLSLYRLVLISFCVGFACNHFDSILI
jgi:hypothetical protein